MTYSDMAARPPIYAYPLVSWGSIWAGVATAVALGLMLSVLGASIGASAFSPYDMSQAQGRAFTLGGGLWVAFANLVALQVGGFVAARSSRYPDHMKGMMQGLAVWAVTTVIAVILAGSILRSGLGGAADFAAYHTGAMDGSGAMSDRDLADAAQAAKHATAAFAWWAFATMALGLVGAVAGGRLGSAHPAWPDRLRYDAAKF